MFAKQIDIRPIDHKTALIVVGILVLLPALYVELTGDFPGAVLFYGQQEDSWLTGVMLDCHTAVFATIATGWTAVNDTLVNVKNFFG
jgi:hypothetical protein